MLNSLTLALALIPGADPGWLPAAEQDRNRTLLEQTGVALPDGLRFYALPKVSQRLSTVNDVDVFGIYPHTYRVDGQLNVNEQYPWVTPSGLHWSPPAQWRAVKAVYFPGAVDVYRARRGVLNSFGHRQPQSYIGWQFPDGTVFAELLIRRHEGREWPFELRVREKRDGAWEGTTYRPFATEDELPAGSTAFTTTVPPGKLSDFGLKANSLSYWKLPERSRPASGAFQATRLTVQATDDESVVPRRYFGNVRACANCHKLAGESTSYGATTIRGDDESLSWHPFRLDTLGTDSPPRLDGQWPLRRVGR